MRTARELIAYLFSLALVGCGGSSLDVPGADASPIDAVAPDAGVADATPGPVDVEAGDALVCTGGTTACGARCVDVLHDPANCGGCAMPCSPNDVCANGVCALGCGGGTTQCGQSCVELRNDPANCGACGVSCGVGGVCVNGGCTTLGGIPDASVGPPDASQTPDASIDGPLESSVPEASVCAVHDTLCNGTCTDTSSDDGNCGGCGAACMPRQVCSQSMCVCAPGATLCGGVCVDSNIDASNCGGCGMACAAGSVCTDGVCAAATSDWPMFGYDAQHTGNNAAETGVPPAIDAWSTTIDAATGALNPVTVENGRAFVTYASYFNGTAPVVAIDASDGSTLWSYNFGAVGSVGHPSVVGGTVYVQTNHGTATSNSSLWALDSAAGTVTWAAAFGSQWEHFWAPLVVGSSVYVDGGYYGGMYGFHVADGSQIFFDSSLGQYDSWSPAYFNGNLYTFIDGSFSSEDPSTGAVLATTAVMWNWTGYSMDTAPVFGPSYGYVISPPNLLAIDPTKSAVVWTANGTYTGTPAIADGVVYGISAGNLIARDATTGALLATLVGDQALKYPPVVAAGHVYAASDNDVYAWNVKTHAQVWTAPVGGWIAIAARRLFVASSTGVLHGFVLSK